MRIEKNALKAKQTVKGKNLEIMKMKAQTPVQAEGLKKQVSNKPVSGKIVFEKQACNGEKVLIASCESIPNYKITCIKGLVWASNVRSVFILKDIIALGRIIAGGEVKEYTELANEARHDVLKKINENTKKINANAVIGLRMVTSQIVPGTIETLAFGTAVCIEKIK